MEKFLDYSLLQDNLVRAIDQKAEPVENTLNLRWIHKSPQSRANQIHQLLGSPDTLEPEPGGIVVWNTVDPFFRETRVAYDSRIKPTTVYSKLVIKDEEIPHLVPVPHTDWFYAYMYLDIPDDKVMDVLHLTESVGYDTMSKEVYARCHFMPANLTSLYLVKQIAQGHKSLAHAQQEYVVLIPTLAKEEMEGKGVSAKEGMGPWHLALTQYTFGLR